MKTEATQYTEPGPLTRAQEAKSTPTHIWTQLYGLVERRLPGQPAPLHCDSCATIRMHDHDKDYIADKKDWYQCRDCGRRRAWGMR